MRLILPPLLALYLIGPRLPSLGVLGDTISLVSALAVAALILRAFWSPVELPAGLVPFLALLLALSAYSGVVAVINGKETFYFERSLRVLLNFCGGVALGLAARVAWRERATTRVLVIAYAVISAHGALIIAEFLSPPLREVVYSVTAPVIHPENLNFRMAGLTNGAGAGTSLVQFLAMLILPVVWSRCVSVIGRTAILLSVLVNLVAFFLTGRTGLFLAAVFLPLVAIAWRWWTPRGDTGQDTVGQAGRWWRTLIASASALAMIAVFAGVVLKAVDERGLGLSLATAADRTFRTFLDYRDTGQLKDDTVEDLYGRHLIIPNDLPTFVFGSGTTSRDLVDSDIGYVQFIFGIGIIGTAAIVGFYLLIIALAWRERRADPALALLSAALAVALLIANTKEPFLLARYYFSMTSLMLTLLFARSTTSVARRAPRFAGERAAANDHPALCS